MTRSAFLNRLVKIQGVSRIDIETEDWVFFRYDEHVYGWHHDFVWLMESDHIQSQGRHSMWLNEEIRKGGVIGCIV